MRLGRVAHRVAQAKLSIAVLAATKHPAVGWHDEVRPESVQCSPSMRIYHHGQENEEEEEIVNVQVRTRV
jgi:hypothetical protein